MKQTLLQITQNILNDLDSDEVNSINDTTESQQVAEIVRQAFFDIISTRNWSHLSGLVQFTAVINPLKPTHIIVPEDVKELNFIKYDKRDDVLGDFDFKDVKFMEPYTFLDMLNRRKSTADNIRTIDNGDGAQLLIQDDKAPEYWTSFNDREIVFDSFNKFVESTIQNNKMQVMCYRTPGWSVADDFVPDLPTEAFSKLVAEAKSNAFLTLKQVANEKAEATSQRQSRWLSRKAWTTNGGVRYPDYGRGRARRKDPTFEQGR